MNKIYKVVWNNTLQCFTVVSEIAKSRTKNQAKAVVGSVLFTTLLGMYSTANASSVLMLPTGKISSLTPVDSLTVENECLQVDPFENTLVVNNDVLLKTNSGIIGNVHVKGNFYADNQGNNSKDQEVTYI
ncbi:MAG: ESPR domain-containing protein [Succinivibrio sp.]|nr:ESPR domain-containing protein [Succinivibrio sp.]